MRKFFLHTYDGSNTFDLNTTSALAAEPTGLGNSFDLAYSEDNKGKNLVNVKPAFEAVVLKIYFNADGTDGYANYKGLMLFLAECGTGKLLLEYNDGVTDKFADVVLKSNTKSEIAEDGVFVETFTFERQTYWYERVEESFALKVTDSALTKFPLGFPFGFVGRVFKKQQKISNAFFTDAPITITISGQIKRNIYIYISTLTGEIVHELQLSTNNADGTVIVIEPMGKKITVETGGEITNGYRLTDKTKQSFLYLPRGTYYIGSNMDADDKGEIAFAIRRYLLD